MKKVRVLKEMPFAKVGDEFECNDCESLKLPTQKEISAYYEAEMHPSDIHYYPTAVHVLVRDGWLEWVEEEKSLEDKFKDVLHGFIRNPKNPDYIEFSTFTRGPLELAQIAKEHYLKVFDNVVLNNEVLSKSSEDTIRKALEKA